ncbi:MAG: flippase-like domain-containing protein, partial [Candidatus Methanoperedens sp.]
AIFLLIVGIIMLIISWQDERMSLKFIRNLPFLNKFTENISFFKERSIQVKDSVNAILIMTLIGWIFAALQWFYLGRALGIELPYYVFFLLHPLLSILMFVPLSPAGLGLMEGGAIVVFSFFGIPAAEGLAFSVLVRVSILLVDLIGLKSVVAASDEIGMKYIR